MTKLTKRGNTQVARPLPRFHVVTGVRCNRCNKTLYLNEGDVEQGQILPTLRAANGTWEEWGEPGHVCD